MKANLFFGATLAAAALAASPAMAADYLPVGPQTNIAVSTVTGGGWSLCYSATMGTPFGTSASTTLAACTSDRIMLAGRATGSDTLLVLAQAPKADALFNTGAADNGVFHTANGSNWFYADNWSWGFLPAGQTQGKLQCGYDSPNASMCVHTLTIAGGFSINTTRGLNSSADYEKLVYQFVGSPAAAVPEPATWGLMVFGLGMVGGTLRRRTAKLSLA